MKPALAAIAALQICLSSAQAQQAATTPLRKIEREMLERISDRATAMRGFRLRESEFDLRLPLRGEPEEITGPTIHADGALAVGSARIESLDSIASPDLPFLRARYDMRLEDRQGNCVIVHQEVSIDSAVVRRRRTTEPCQPLYMAGVVRRNKRIARLPFEAGRLEDHWSAALAATGTVDVYQDSVVITASALGVRASHPIPETASVQIDSIDVGLASGDGSWSIVRHSVAARVDTALRRGGEWRRRTKRFMIPVDSSFNLAHAWPVFQVHLTVPPTADNPSGSAWTYAHVRKTFFLQLPTARASR